MHFQLLLAVSHQQMEEMEAILVEVQVDLVVQEATDQEEHQGHQRM